VIRVKATLLQFDRLSVLDRVTDTVRYRFFEVDKQMKEHFAMLRLVIPIGVEHSAYFLSIGVLLSPYPCRSDAERPDGDPERACGVSESNWGVVLVKIVDGSVMRSKTQRAAKLFSLLRVLMRGKKN
jgi:hypothetical protein